MIKTKTNNQSKQPETLDNIPKAEIAKEAQKLEQKIKKLKLDLVKKSMSTKKIPPKKTEEKKKQTAPKKTEEKKKKAAEKIIEEEEKKKAAQKIIDEQKTFEEELEEQLTDEEIENFKIEKTDMDRLTNKVCEIVAQYETNGVLQSELWKKLKLTSRDGSRLALKLERMGIITREKILQLEKKSSKGADGLTI